MKALHKTNLIVHYYWNLICLFLFCFTFTYFEASKPNQNFFYLVSNWNKIKTYVRFYWLRCPCWGDYSSLPACETSVTMTESEKIRPL